jgi:hypothetical protein
MVSESDTIWPHSLFFRRNMQYHHCGIPLDVGVFRDLKPTAIEEAKGVIALRAETRWCKKPDCRRKFYFTQEIYEKRTTELKKLKKPRHISAITKRLKTAKESDWVWSWHPETFQKVKRFVR